MIQKEKSVKDWLIKLIGRLRRNRTGSVSLKRGSGRETDWEFQIQGGDAISPCPLCGVLPINRTIHNNWCRFVSETKNTERLLVGIDGGAVRVPVDPAKAQTKTCVDPAPDPRWQLETTPYRNRYKCLYGNKNCGEHALYCEPCNKRYEEFLWLLNDDR